MGYNSEPGQSASGFRLYIDNQKKSRNMTREEIVLGAMVKYGHNEYEIVKINGEDVHLEYNSGASKRFTIVTIDSILNK